MADEGFKRKLTAILSADVIGYPYRQYLRIGGSGTIYVTNGVFPIKFNKLIVVYSFCFSLCQGGFWLGCSLRILVMALW
jgi:hypothetical protein